MDAARMEQEQQQAAFNEQYALYQQEKEEFQRIIASSSKEIKKIELSNHQRQIDE